MTQQEFDQSRFSSKDIVIYRGSKYRIKTVNYYERLFGLSIWSSDGDYDDDLIWVRCENVEIAL